MSPAVSQDPTKQAIWEVESTHPDVTDDLEDALREVIDPEIGLNIIELGLVRDLVIEDDKAKITMVMTTPFCPYAPALLEMTRNWSMLSKHAVEHALSPYNLLIIWYLDNLL